MVDGFNKLKFRFQLAKPFFQSKDGFVKRLFQYVKQSFMDGLVDGFRYALMALFMLVVD